MYQPFRSSGSPPERQKAHYNGRRCSNNGCCLFVGLLRSEAQTNGQSRFLILGGPCFPEQFWVQDTDASYSSTSQNLPTTLHFRLCSTLHVNLKTKFYKILEDPPSGFLFLSPQNRCVWELEIQTRKLGIGCDCYLRSCVLVNMSRKKKSIGFYVFGSVWETPILLT